MSQKAKYISKSTFAVLGGIAFLSLGLLMYLDYSGGNIDNPVETTGVVIRLHASTATSTNPFQGDTRNINPVVEFRTEEGKRIEFLEMWAKEEEDNEYRKGMKVPVIYNSEFPEDAIIKKGGSFWGIHLVLLGMGLFMFLIPWIIKPASD
ncbi:DUF3592 domain-containing protein [Bacteroidota bacterium]